MQVLVGSVTLPHLASPYKGEEQDTLRLPGSLAVVFHAVNACPACPELVEGKDLLLEAFGCWAKDSSLGPSLRSGQAQNLS